MLKNYLVIAWRHLWKNKLHLGINILGLAIGLGASLGILAMVEFELGFNKGFEDREQIMRVYTRYTGDFEGTNRGICGPMRKAIGGEVSAISAQANISTFQAKVAIPDEWNLKTLGRYNDIAFVNEGYFEVFSGYKWLAGDRFALLKPYQLVLSKKKAEAYFGEGDFTRLLGKELIYRDSLRVQLAGIVDVPNFRNDLYFGDFISESTIDASFLKDEFSLDEWDNTNSNMLLFIKTAPKSDLGQVAGAINQIERPLRDSLDFGNGTVYELQALNDLHFNTDLNIFDHSRSAANLSSLWLLAGIAGLILLLAGINYINYATAISLQRSREVGVRKVMGSGKGSLIVQFLSETLLLTLVAGVLGYILAEIGLSYLQDMMPVDIEDILRRPIVIVILLFVILLGAFLSGLYPSFLLSSFPPAQALKNQIPAGNSNKNSVALVRQGLLTFQFVAAQILVMLTLIVIQQHKHMINKDLGFRKKAIIYFQFPFQFSASVKLRLQATLGDLPFVDQTSLHHSPPAMNGMSMSEMSYKDDSVSFNEYVHRKQGDTSFIHLFDIPLLAGRNVRPRDTVSEFLINETLMRKIGVRNPIDAIGKELKMGDQKCLVVGVMRDFFPLSLKYEVPPLVYSYSKSSFTLSLLVNSTSTDLPQNMQKIEKTWKETLPELPFEPQFLDQSIEAMYKSERITSVLLLTASTSIILIACMGLFGLSMLLISHKSKEISIRKVLGASVLQILNLLSRSFVQLIGLAFLLALPLGWYIGGQFLNGFASRIDLNWWLFALTGLATLILGLSTVSILALRAATSNPVEFLKNE